MRWAAWMMSKRLEPTVDEVGRVRHPQLLKQDKRFLQKTNRVRRACLVFLAQRDVGLAQERAGQLRMKPLALCDRLSSCQVRRCCFPLSAQGCQLPQDAINKEPVILTAKIQ